MIQKMLSLSAGHITDETANWLEEQCDANKSNDAAVIHAASHIFGWFVYCHDDNLEDYPKDLADVLAYARNKHGCDYVNIDCDGAEYTDLPLYPRTTIIIKDEKE
jgi:hypothetical protein